jgi:RNA polymerase sigma-32 factor
MAKKTKKSPTKLENKSSVKLPPTVEAELVEDQDRFDPEQVILDQDGEPLEPLEALESLDPLTEVLDDQLLDSLSENLSGESPLIDQLLLAAKPTKGNRTALTTTNDPVATYLAEIRRYPLLTKEQEREIAIRYRETGDPRAAEMLVTSNLRFVVKVAAEYSKFGAKLIDLIQEGNVGLMHAVREFNPYKGVRLITYAVWWIRGYIQEYMMRQYSMVRIGTTQNQRKLFYRLQKERDALEHMGQEATPALLAGRLGVSEEEVEVMSKRLSGRDVSLNQPLDGESSSTSLLDQEINSQSPIDEEIGQRQLLEVLKSNLEKIRPKLNVKELYILEHRLLADEPAKLQEIGEHFGVTREAVRQVEARLIDKIRAAVSEVLK